MGEESWHEARLIPTSGISGPTEQERRATSALLAVMAAVKEFGRVLTKPYGAPAGTIATFTEVPFKHGDGRLYPDGLIRVERGKKAWTALVEVKTGKNTLDAQQLESYLDIARAEEFDAVISISNEIPPMAGQHPTKIDKRRLRKVALHHLSWANVLAEAVMQREFRGVADPDQAWILGELIRYLEHPRSGAMEFDDMGGHWVGVRDAVKSGTLRAGDAGVKELAARFDALLRFVSLELGRNLGTEVTPALTRKELADPVVRTQKLVTSLVDDGMLTGSIRIPDTVGNLAVTADLRAGTVTAHIDVDAPKEGRPRTRVNWLARQLKAAPGDLRIEAHAAHSRGAGAAELLRDVRENPDALVPENKQELRWFRVAMSVPMGAKRGRGRGSFIDSVRDCVDVFYADVMQNLKAWSAAPPKVRPVLDDIEEGVPEQFVSTALSSQDDPVTS
ncbi:hypothetical protein [Myceligenerans xiligouense]|uniref:Stress response protein n=1 Tax=Myceligenerans xiligouense TaxID=253184 RepID=A0A3N4Z6N5_9MICO|nr:hypothetical protein [Myceligenerans xiligouense]RPF20952.1 hypothetical protein EDD34_1560 [Myceligenerans xiligouense]